MKEKFICKVCQQEFNTKQPLREHVKRAHPELFDYKCELCGFLAEDLRSLMIHVTKKHNPKEYFDKYILGTEKCKLEGCDNLLTFENRYSGYYCCQQHYESQKKLDKGIDVPYKCEICNSLFEDLGRLQRHLNDIHSFDKKQKLEYYDRYFKKEDEGDCLYCGERLKLIKDSFSEGYMKFCYNKDCNVRWYNENTDRLDKFSKSMTETLKNNPENLNVKIEFWMSKGFGEEEAKQKLSERQTTFSKEICIEKHGEIDGLKKWNDRQEKWQDVLKSKPDEEIKRINRAKANNFTCMSVAEREICSILEAESQFVISTEIGYVYDMIKNGKIIEYHGDYWHCNPKIYDKDYYNQKLHKTAEEKWKIDKDKIDYAKNNGYEVLVVWEKDYKKDKLRVIKECIEFISG